jgi:hypothetical protein
MNTRMLRMRPGVMAALVLMSLLGATTRGGMIPVGKDDNAYKTYGLDPKFSSVIGLKVEAVEHDPWYTSAFLFADGNGYWAYTAAHNLGGTVLSVTGLSGANILTSPTATIAADRWVIYPTYDGNIGYTDDIALIHFVQTFPDRTPVQVSVDPVNVGDIIDFAGYGKPGFAGQGLLDQDGFIRGGQDMIDYVNGPRTGFQFDSRYIGSIFDRTNSVYCRPLEMLLTPGDSGSPILNAQGEAFALHCFNYGSYEYGDRTGDLLLAPYQSWTNSVVNVPEPGSLSMMALLSIALLRLRRKAV